MSKVLVVLGGLTLISALLLSVAIATIVGVGRVLNYLVPAVSLEFACVIAGLAILIGFRFVSAFFRFIQLAGYSSVEMEDDEATEGEPEQFAEHIAEIVSEKLEPHFLKQRRAKLRRR